MGKACTTICWCEAAAWGREVLGNFSPQVAAMVVDLEIFLVSVGGIFCIYSVYY